MYIFGKVLSKVLWDAREEERKRKEGYKIEGDVEFVIRMRWIGKRGVGRVEFLFRLSYIGYFSFFWVG